MGLKDKWINFKDTWKVVPWVLASLCLVKFVLSLYGASINPFISELLRKTGSKGYLVGLTSSLNYVAGLLTLMFFGYYSEWSNLGRNFIITASLITIGSVTIFFSLTKELYQMAILLVVAGLSFSAALSTVYSIITDLFSEEYLTFAITIVEFVEAFGWMICPVIFSLIRENTDKVFYPFLFFTVLQIIVAIANFLVLRFKLPRIVKEKIMSEKVETPLMKRLSYFYKSRDVYISFIVNTLTNFAYFMVSNIYGSLIPEHLIKVYYSVPSGMMAVLSIPFLNVNKRLYIIFSLPLISLCYLCHSFLTIDLRAGHERWFDFGVVSIIFVRDYAYYLSYVFCNFVIVEAVSIKNPEVELNGFCSSIYVISMTLGATIGITMGNHFNEVLVNKMEIFKFASYSLFGGFFVLLMIHFLGRK